MHDAAIHSAKSFLINFATRYDCAAGDVTAAQGFCQRDDVRLEVPMLEAKHLSGAAKSSLHFIGNEERAVLAAKLLRAHKKICLGQSAAFALNRFDHEGSDVARTQLSIQRIDIVKRH